MPSAVLHPAPRCIRGLLRIINSILVHTQWTESWDTLGWWADEELARRPRYGTDQRDGGEPAFVLAVEYAPGRRHTPLDWGDHYTAFILEGSLETTRETHGPGTVRHVHGGDGSGPVVAGPQGATVLLVHHRSLSFMGGCTRSVFVPPEGESTP